MAVFVELSGFGPPTVDVLVEVNANDLARRKEPVGDALLEGVSENRLAEVINVGNILGFFGRSGEADLRGAGEVFENLPPVDPAAFPDRVSDCCLSLQGPRAGCRV